MPYENFLHTLDFVLGGRSCVYPMNVKNFVFHFVTISHIFSLFDVYMCFDCMYVRVLCISSACKGQKMKS